MRVMLSDCRKVKFCSKGVRLFCAKYKLDYKKFLMEGIEVSILEGINDSMANKAVEVRRGRE